MKKILSVLIFSAFTQFLLAQDITAELPMGSPAPDFIATDQNGRELSLASLTQKGPVVILFYRGEWCPYCNKQLSEMQDSLALITGKGATVLAVTPETSENVAKTVAKTKTSFSIISDKGLKIMKAYQVAFAVDEATQKKYKGYGIDFEKANGENKAVLPVPAVYVINKEGKIAFSYFDTNYRKRLSVKEIADRL